MTDIEKINESIFESIKHVNEYGQEYWDARELQPVLEYRQWRQFSDVIEKAKSACDTSKIRVSDHFADVRKIVKAGATSKPIEDLPTPDKSIQQLERAQKKKLKEIEDMDKFFDS